MQLQLVLASAVLALSVSTQQVAAYPKYVKLLPNGGAVPDAPAIGHPDAEGAEGVNAFGKAFKAAGNTWTVALCQADTDGDGFTNGQELGDPCCTWTTTNVASLITDGISHPSDATKKPSNAKLIAGCSSTSTSTSTSTTPSATSTTPSATTVTPSATTATPGKNSTATPAKNSTATTTKPKETVSDVLAPVSATKAPSSASKSTDIDDFANSDSGSATTVTATKAPSKLVSTNSTNTTSGALATTAGVSSSVAVTVALVCVSALAAAF
ncbi:hypothetical protein Gpo141_00008666 [Globisporangium polare]